MTKSVVVAACLLGVGFSQAVAEEPILERIEWSDVWVVNANADDATPRVLLVGDSITRGYYGAVEKRVGDRANLARYATSKFLSNPDYLEELGLLLKRYDFEVIHLNNGLHGWDYTEDQYEAGLKELIAYIQKTAPDAQIVWAMSTPIRNADNLDEFASERNDRVLERNRIAKEVMDANDIPINDLYAAVADHPEYHGKDGVHFNGQGQEVQAEHVAESLKPWLE